MKISTVLPMKFDVSKPGLNQFSRSNVKKVVIADVLQSKSIFGEDSKLQPPLAPSVEQSIRAEIDAHKQSSKKTAAKVESLRNWQSWISWPLGATGVVLGGIAVGLLANPVAASMGYAVLLVSGHTALVAAASVMLGIAACLFAAKIGLEVAIYLQEKKADGARAYVDHLEAELAQYEPAAKAA